MYLKAPDSKLIFVRKKKTVSDANMNEIPRQELFNYECREEMGSQRVQKKRIIDGREYDTLIASQQDLDREQLKILRTSFIYENNYFRLETHTNKPGCPTFLRLESHEEDSAANLVLPPFVPIAKEVTGDHYYSASNISREAFELKY